MALEWMVTGNLGKDPERTKSTARCTMCCNVPVNGAPDTEPVWLDIETSDIGMATRLLDMGKGDGVMVRGMVRVNYYEHNGKRRKGWVIDLNTLLLTHRAA